MSLPPAIAVGGADTPDAVKPLRIGIGAGVLAALYLLVMYMAHPIPVRMISLLGGPSDAFERQGGLRMMWLPPDGTDIAKIEERFAVGGAGARLRRENDGFFIEVPGVAARDVETVAAQIAQGSGVLRFHEVLEVSEMRDLARVLELPMSGKRPVDLEIDQWRPEEGPQTHTDYYLFGDTREVLEAALAEAGKRGWKLPAGAAIGFEAIEPYGTSPGGWRTYVLAETAELDGDAIHSAVGSYDPNTSRPLVFLDFTKAAADRFGNLTARIVGKKLAIVVDGLIKSAPIINGAIRGGRASISMGGNDPVRQEHERDVLVSVLSGAGLPGGGRLLATSHVPAGDTTVKVWIARLLISLGGGALVGLLAWAFVRRFRPTRRHAPARAPGPVPWTRIAVTLLAPVAIIGLSYVPVLGIDYAELEESAGSDIKSYLNAGILGLSPIITAYVLVELLALVIPGWRRRRHAGEEARRPLLHAVVALAFVLVMIQSWMIIQYLESMSRGILLELNGRTRGLLILSFAGATLALGVVARVIRRHGLGNGVGALVVSGWLVGIVWPWLKMDPVLSKEHVVGATTLLVIAVPIAVALRWRVGAVGESSLRIPTSGIAPLGDAGGLVVLLALLGTTPFLELTVAVADLTQLVRSHLTLLVALLLATTVVWSYAFARPATVAGIAARVGLARPSRGTFWRGTALSAALLLFVFAPMLIPDVVPYAVLVAPLTVATVVAVVFDLVDDLRARRGELAVAWSLHSPHHADLVIDDLAKAEIRGHLAASHLRTLMASFAPFAPIDVLVPAEHLLAARARIAKLLT